MTTKRGKDFNIQIFFSFRYAFPSDMVKHSFGWLVNWVNVTKRLCFPLMLYQITFFPHFLNQAHGAHRQSSTNHFSTLLTIRSTIFLQNFTLSYSINNFINNLLPFHYKSSTITSEISDLQYENSIFLMELKFTLYTSHTHLHSNQMNPK